LLNWQYFVRDAANGGVRYLNAVYVTNIGAILLVVMAFGVYNVGFEIVTNSSRRQVTEYFIYVDMTVQEIFFFHVRVELNI